MTIQKLRQRAMQLNRDDRGEIPVGPILIIGLIVVPLVLILWTFREDLTKWFEKKYDEVLNKK